MIVYTVHEPADAPADALSRADAAAFVKEGIAWWALFVPVLWLLYHRLWVVLALYVSAMILLHGGLAWAGVGEATSFWVTLVISILFAVQANDLRRWTLERRGFRLVGTVSGRTLAECELKYFASVVEAAEPVATEPPLAAPAPVKPTRPRSDNEIIGLFPDKA